MNQHLETGWLGQREEAAQKQIFMSVRENDFILPQLPQMSWKASDKKPKRRRDEFLFLSGSQEQSDSGLKEIIVKPKGHRFDFHHSSLLSWISSEEASRWIKASLPHLHLPHLHHVEVWSCYSYTNRMHFRFMKSCEQKWEGNVSGFRHHSQWSEGGLVTLLDPALHHEQTLF